MEIGENGNSKQPAVFFLCIPIGEVHEGRAERLLCATLDADYFESLLHGLSFWNDQGDVVMCDSKGYIIATRFEDMVRDRNNYILLAKEVPELQSLADFFVLMVNGGKGFNEHTLRGEKRVGYYRPVSGSSRGWSLAATAPILSSPYRGTMWWINIPALVSLIFTGIVAYFASAYLVKPYHEAFRARESAERASESKSTFLANMSHEMRTPLNAIIGLSELAIGSDEATGEIAVNLEKIYNSGVTLLGTINDLLDISKIESGKFDLVPVAYDLPSLINDTVALNSVRIGSKPIEFTINVDEDLPGRYRGDELRIKQMLNNLLSNAFKYTREGQVIWSISYERKDGEFFLVFKIFR
jgi:signal transduction histidine kinase